jgi:hypothetical protein
MAHTFSKRVAEAGIDTIDSDAGILGPTQAINGTTAPTTEILACGS